jgi:hypothetical protein
MGMFDKVKKNDAPAVAEQAVIVQFNYMPASLDELAGLEDQLVEAIERGAAGALDGHEIALDGRDTLVYMYGPDADRLYAAIEPVLLMWEALSEARVLLRYGPPGIETRQRTVVLPKYSGTRH